MIVVSLFIFVVLVALSCINLLCIVEFIHDVEFICEFSYNLSAAHVIISYMYHHYCYTCRFEVGTVVDPFRIILQERRLIGRRGRGRICNATSNCQCQKGRFR